MGDIDILRSCGVALHGDRWRASLATDLNVTERTIRHWLAGDHPIPDDVIPRLLRLLQNRQRGIDDLVRLLDARIAKG